MGLLDWPECPKCGEEAVEMKQGKTGWKWSKKGPARRSPTWLEGGGLAYMCPNGHEWELDKKGNLVE